MKPIVKYQGGKSREFNYIKTLLPDIKSIVEPFCGGAAISFGLEVEAKLNDINSSIINLYNIVSSDEYVWLKDKVETLKTLQREQLEKEYYLCREQINLSKKQNKELAYSYIVVRQLCFSGMERYNSDGLFNVPFGHYNKFTCNLSDAHHKFLKNCTITNYSFSEFIGSISKDDFIFLDPPYLSRLGYSTGDGGKKMHNDLLDILSNIENKWLLVHSDHPFYRQKYDKFNIVDKDFGYSQRFGKNKNHKNAKVKHLYIKNY